VTLPNGFDGPWNPICPDCGGYMHTGHTPDCPVTKARELEMEKLVSLLNPQAAHSQSHS
jgi:hypothetical protein